MPIGLSEYQARRARVLEELDGACSVVLAGSGEPPLVGRWKPDQHFRYLTGIDNEPDAAVLFDPGHPSTKRRCVLFLKPWTPERDDWDGRRERLGSELRTKTGFETVLRTTHLPGLLTDAARRSGTLACLHPPAPYTAPVSNDLGLYKKIAERVPGVAIKERSQLLPSLRAVKSEGEIALMKRAIEASAAGYRALAGALKPGVRERDLQRAFENAIRDAGAEGAAYNPIVGSGPNATVLHYTANDGVVGENDLLVVDAGASVEGYAADITRTFPASGSFNARQRELYELVLRSQEASIDAVKPGATLWDADAAARDVIDEAGYGDFFIHGIGHQLGLEVHDVNPDGPLREGMVVTIEPGVYLPEEGIGIRIEDDILVTASGNENLSGGVPKGVSDLEAMVK